MGVPADGGAALPHAPDRDPDGAPGEADTASADVVATDPAPPGSPADAPAPPAGEREADTPTLETPSTDTSDAEVADAPVAGDLAGPDDLDGLLDADDLDEIPDHPCDDVLFDPLLSDEPIDLAAVRADDALIDALGGGDLDAARDLIDADDPLIAMLAAWAASARPDVEPEPEPERSRPSLTLVGTADDGTGAVDDVPDRPQPPERADIAASLEPDGTPAALVEVPAAVGPAAEDPTPDDPTADGPTPAAATTVGTVRRLVPPPVLGVLDRARVARRRTGPRSRPLPAGQPLRRAAVAVVLAALGVSAAAAAGGTARPGEASFAMTRVFFSERAESLEAAQVVAEGLERARVYIAQRQPALAAQELADVQNRLPEVRDEEGHRQLVGQQQVLADAVALTPPAPPAADRTPGPTTRDADPDTSILAAPPAPPAPPAPTAAPDATTPDATPGGADVVAAPSEDAASGDAPAPGTDSAAPGGAGTAGTPSEVVAAPVSGATVEGTVTAEPTPVTGTSEDDATTTVTATSAPTDPPTTTSRTPTSTTSSSTSAPPSNTGTRTDDGGTVATGSVPADGSPIVVRPAAHHEAPVKPVQPVKPVAVAKPAGTGHAAPAPRPAPHHAPVVITTVPRPVRATTDDAVAVDDDVKANAASSRDRHRAAAHPAPDDAAPAGVRLSGDGEVPVRARAD